MRAFGRLLWGHAIGLLLLGEALVVERSNEAHVHLNPPRGRSVAGQAISLASSSNLTGLLAMLTDVVKKNAHSPTSVETAKQLEPAIGILNDSIEPNMKESFMIMQHSISGFEGLFLHCEELALKAFNKSIADQSRVVQLRLDHASCREQEADLTGPVGTCQNLLTAAQTVQAYRCRTYQEANTITAGPCLPTGEEDAEAFHARKLQEFEANLALLATRKAECDNATASANALQAHCDSQASLLQQTRSTCNRHQHVLDSGICKLKGKMESDCSSSQTCQTQAMQSYSLANASVAKDEESIQAQWQQIQQVRCLYDVLNQNKSFKYAHSCTQKKFSVDHLSVNYSGAPPFSPCESLQETPGSPEYMQSLYGSLNAKAPVEACTSQCCLEANATASTKQQTPSSTPFPSAALPFFNLSGPPTALAG